PTCAPLTNNERLLMVSVVVAVPLMTGSNCTLITFSSSPYALIIHLPKVTPLEFRTTWEAVNEGSVVMVTEPLLIRVDAEATDEKVVAFTGAVAEIFTP